MSFKTGFEHKQVLATVNKVNEKTGEILGKTQAYVDEKLKGLIEVLNCIEGLSTYESCQGFKNTLASIWLLYSKPLSPIQAAEKLWRVVSRFELSEITVELEWSTNLADIVLNPSLILQFPQEYIDELTEAFKKDSQVQGGGD